MPGRIRGLHHVVLTVSDPVRSAAFYEAVLGLEAFPGDDLVRCISCGAFLLCLQRAPGGGIPGDRFDENRIGLDHIGFSVESGGRLEELLSVLAGLGVPTAGIEFDPGGEREYVCFPRPRQHPGGAVCRGLRRLNRQPGEMALTPAVTIVDVGYRSTHYWVVSAGESRLLVDLGWPGTMGRMRAELRRKGIPIEQIRYGLATHYHIDHAGLAQELKTAGVPLLVLEPQVEAIQAMRRWTKPQDNYIEISLDGNVTIACSESRARLSGIGISGEVLHTPGHSDNSVSLVLDDGSAFIGDLTRPQAIGPEDASTVVASWRLLQEHGANRIYPAHGPIAPISAFLPV